MSNDNFKQIASGKNAAPATDPVAPAPVPQACIASCEAQLIGYALSRHVPAMQSGFEVITSYGSWNVYGELAEQVAELVHLYLMKQLETVESKQ